MANDGQQYNEQNFAEDQQYNDYNEQNYSEAMEEGGGSGDQNQSMNGDESVSTKAPTDEDKYVYSNFFFYENNILLELVLCILLNCIS